MDDLRLDLLPKVQDQRVRRVVVARVAGAKFKDIADSEGVTVEGARQLWSRGKRLLDLLSKVPDKLTPDSLIEYTLTSVRFRNVCRAAGILTVVDLASHTRREFLCNKNCSGKTLREAEKLLAEADMEFYDDCNDHLISGEPPARAGRSE